MAKDSVALVKVWECKIADTTHWYLCTKAWHGTRAVSRYKDSHVVIPLGLWKTSHITCISARPRVSTCGEAYMNFWEALVDLAQQF